MGDIMSVPWMMQWVVSERYLLDFQLRNKYVFFVRPSTNKGDVFVFSIEKQIGVFVIHGTAKGFILDSSIETPK